MTRNQPKNMQPLRFVLQWIQHSSKKEHSVIYDPFDYILFLFCKWYSMDQASVNIFCKTLLLTAAGRVLTFNYRIFFKLQGQQS